MIRFEQVSKRFPTATADAVHDLTLDVAAGELLVLLGESGCGKTTTLKLINRLVEPTSGSIRVDGADISAQDAVELRRGIGYVFQGVGLFPHMTVAANVAVLPGLLGWTATKSRRRVHELLELVGLPPTQFASRLPAELSGGQQQRVGVARALAARPRILLMDEPFGALDPLTRDTLQNEFRRMHRQLGLTTVLVTHDMTEALLLADRISVMRGGRLLRTGTPHALMSAPGDEYVHRLMDTPRREARRVEQLMAEPPQGNGT